MFCIFFFCIYWTILSQFFLTLWHLEVISALSEITRWLCQCQQDKGMIRVGSQLYYANKSKHIQITHGTPTGPLRIDGVGGGGSEGLCIMCQLKITYMVLEVMWPLLLQLLKLCRIHWLGSLILLSGCQSLPQGDSYFWKDLSQFPWNQSVIIWIMTDYKKMHLLEMKI